MIFLGLGSNLQSDFGDRYENIELAINYLRENNINLLQKSSFYESVSYPNKNDPKFINVVIAVETPLKSVDLMNRLAWQTVNLCTVKCCWLCMSNLLVSAWGGVALMRVME